LSGGHVSARNAGICGLFVARTVMAAAISAFRRFGFWFDGPAVRALARPAGDVVGAGRFRPDVRDGRLVISAIPSFPGETEPRPRSRALRSAHYSRPNSSNWPGIVPRDGLHAGRMGHCLGQRRVFATGGGSRTARGRLRRAGMQAMRVGL
jgi:hypothetical protein